MRVLTPTENNRLNELIGFIGMTIAILTALALISYSPHDPSFNVSADSPDVHAARNWIGLVGAYGADLFFQGFGYAFMFIPVSQLAYSYLPKNKNNKGSSLTNLCRNWGASFGISFVTTMLERRTQYHQSVLVSNLTSADGSVRQFVRTSSHFLVTRGASTPDAIHQAYGLVGSMMNQQAAMLAFMDCFHLLAIVVLAGLPLAFLIRRFEIGKAAGTGH